MDGGDGNITTQQTLEFLESLDFLSENHPSEKVVTSAAFLLEKLTSRAKLAIGERKLKEVTELLNGNTVMVDEDPITGEKVNLISISSQRLVSLLVGHLGLELITETNPGMPYRIAAGAPIDPLCDEPVRFDSDTFKCLSDHMRCVTAGYNKVVCACLLVICATKSMKIAGL